MLLEGNNPLNTDFTAVTILKGKNFCDSIDCQKLLPDITD